MESEQKIAQPLVLVGLILLVFLSFETFRGTYLNIEKVMPIDSTYIVALVDVVLISIGMVLGLSRKLTKYRGKAAIDFVKLVIMLAVFLLAAFMITSSMAVVLWNNVEWFEPKLNFELIGGNLQNGLFVSQFLILVLVLIFAFQGYEPKSKTEEKTQASRI